MTIHFDHNNIYFYRYTIDNYEDGFILDLRVEICLPMDGKEYCIPSEGLLLLEDEQIPACSLSAWTNLTGLLYIN
jgi:hypothetical protein